MSLTDTASHNFTFHAKDHKSGIITCRHCQRQVFIKITLRMFLIFATTKVKIVGEWCNCSDINEAVRYLIDESLGMDENVDVL